MPMKSNNDSIANFLKRLWKLLPVKRRRQLAILLLLMLISAFAEVMSLGAVIPFLAVITAPSKAMENPFFGDLIQRLDIATASELTLFLTTIFIFAAVAAAVLRLTLLWATNRLSQSIGSDLSVMLFERTIFQPYQVHTSSNSSAILSGITKINATIMVISQCLALLSASVLIVTVATALILVNPTIAFSSIFAFGTFYAAVSYFTRKTLARNSKSIAENQTLVFKIAQEGLGGIREVILGATQSIYVNLYRKADYPLRQKNAQNGFISGSPRFVIEAIGIAVIAFLAYRLSLQPAGITSALPMLGAFALGAQRVLPVLHQWYSAWSTISGNKESLKDTLVLLELDFKNNDLQAEPRPFFFRDNIEFKNVQFCYSSNDKVILSDINFIIPKGSRIGITGETGSGKSTLLDLAMGLILPTSGLILVDGKPLEGSYLRSWQRTIAHVPQDLFLTDASFLENIALGVERAEIDLQAVHNAAERAQISTFIESCALGYDEKVGERGLRLSGGQRQRIGIARALYKDASVIVFDEATSALDQKTEAAVMEAIEQLDDDLTIFIIAHRLTTLEKCTHVVNLSAGQITSLKVHSPDGRGNASSTPTNDLHQK